ncbi:hypothetical protein GRF59_15465 [Paenibacillus sp. HJL G12]|uniref:Uncharacterized protein n=1 Tax=Paenibacillus dendrobii TaxID=2691084 RepID=A0A7X3LGQ6_9BACL|nr:hypothetical protein [Paenibacillus dendrobii]MWV45021.1 hypothetical protein [Paenibacillus dendrobii]
MSKVWVLNIFLLAMVVIALIFLIGRKDIKVGSPSEPPPIVKPSIEIVEQGESVYGYTNDGETVSGKSEHVYLTQAVTIYNPHDFPVTVGGVYNEVYDTADTRIDSDEIQIIRTLAPGEVVQMAGNHYLSRLHFREDYGYSKIVTDVSKGFDSETPYTNLETKNLSYHFKNADPGNTFLQIEAIFANHSEQNVDTTKVNFVIYFYDKTGKVIGGNTASSITFQPERIKPGEEKRISFEGALIGRTFSKNIASVKVFAGCGNCRS